MGIAVNLHRSIAQHINKAQSSRSLLLLPPPPLLWPPLTPTTAPDTAMVDTDMEPTADTAVVFTDTARGPLMLRPTTAMAALAATAMAAMVDTAVVFTDTARGLLMPRPTTAMA